MENNKIVILEEGKEIEYRVLLNVEDENGKNFVLYTKDELDKNGNIISYAAEYVENKETGDIKLKSIKEDKEWEFIKDLMNSIQNGSEN